MSRSGPRGFPDRTSEVTFTILLASMAFVVYLGTRIRIRKVDAALPPLNSRLYVALVLAGVIGGGSVSALTGSGADVLIYLFIVVVLGLDPRVGVPTCVIVMTTVSIVGLIMLGLGDGQLDVLLSGGSTGDVVALGGEPVTGVEKAGVVMASYGTGGAELTAVRFDLFGMWIAAIPVVAWGAPFGSYVAGRMKARQLVYFAVALAVAEVLSTVIFLDELHEFGGLVVYAVVGMAVAGGGLYLLAKYRRVIFGLPGLSLEESLGRGHLDVVPGYEQQLSDEASMIAPADRNEGERMRRIADYELIESLGSGNHGEYFSARPPARLDLDVDLVAVKVLAINASEDAFRRAANELRLFASIDMLGTGQALRRRPAVGSAVLRDGVLRARITGSPDGRAVPRRDTACTRRRRPAPHMPSMRPVSPTATSSRPT